MMKPCPPLQGLAVQCATYLILMLSYHSLFHSQNVKCAGKAQVIIVIKNTIWTAGISGCDYMLVASNPFTPKI